MNEIKRILQSKDDEIRKLKYIIDEKLGGWTKGKRYGLSFDDLLTVLKKADEYDKCFCEKEKNVKTTDKDIDENIVVFFDIPKASSIFASAIVCTEYDGEIIPTKIINGSKALELYNLLRR